MNVDVMKALTGTTTCKLNNEDDLKKANPKTYTATISGAKKVYNLFPGTVLFLGYYRKMGTVTIAISNHEIIRYCNLENIQYWSNSSALKGQYIGTAYARTGLQFEYCTQWKGDSIYPVRIENKIYFKQNPLDILNGSYVPTNEVSIKYANLRPEDKVVMTANQLLEWGPTSIDNSTTYIEGAQII